MLKDEFLSFVSKKREKINYMHQVIVKAQNEELLKSIQLDVLLRGYIVLIYVLWESAFKTLDEYFFEILKEKKVEELPYNLKNEILCSLLRDIQKKEIKSFKCMENAKKDFDNLINLELDKDLKLKEYFQCKTNNPTVDKLEDYLSKFAFSVPISPKLMKEIEYIVYSRNDIAHSGRYIENYSKSLKSFLDEISKSFPNEVQSKNEIDLLQEITLDIYILFENITNVFEEKYA